MRKIERWKWMMRIVATSVLMTSFASAAEVKVKYSGPSGQGRIIYWSPSTGTTNMVFTSNGVSVITFTDEASVSVTGLWSATSFTAIDSVTAGTNVTATAGDVTATAGNLLAPAGVPALGGETLR